MVQCFDCGFLAFRSKTTREIVEADPVIRTDHTLPTFLVHQRPYCMAGIANFVQEVGSAAEDPGDTRVIEVLEQSRDCSGFVTAIHGFSPKDHREMLDRQWMLDREDRRDAAMQRREDERDTRVEQVQQGMHRRELWVMGGVVTIAITLSTVVASVLEGAISRGWEPSWWPL